MGRMVYCFFAYLLVCFCVYAYLLALLSMFACLSVYLHIYSFAASLFFVCLFAGSVVYLGVCFFACLLVDFIAVCLLYCLFVCIICLFMLCLYFALEWNYLYATLHNRLKTALWMQHHSDHEKSHSIEQVRTEKCFSSIKFVLFFFNLQRFESLPFQPNQRSAFTHRLVIDVSSCIPISEDIMCSVQYLPVRETHIIKYIALIKYQMQAVRISSNAAPNGITLY